MQPTQTIAGLRAKPADMQNAHIIVLSGTDPDRPSLMVAGWTEEHPKEAQEVMSLYEPIAFSVVQGSLPNGTMKVAWVMPDHGVPHFKQFTDYATAEIYEGVTSFGTFYLETLLQARTIHPKYEGKWINPLRELTKQPTPPTQAESRRPM